MPQISTDMLAKRTDLESSALLRPYNQSLPFRLHGKEREFLPRSVIEDSIPEARTQAYVKVPATLQGHSGAVRAMAFSPDGKLIASRSVDGTFRLWDPTSEDETVIFPHPVTRKGNTVIKYLKKVYE
jgi:WD40 repeat protein